MLHIIVLPALGVPPPVYEPLLAAIDALPGNRASLLPLPPVGTGWRAAWASRRTGYREWLSIIEAQVAQLRAEEAASHVVLLGHSIGGQVALVALARQAVAIDGLVLVASGTPCWRAWPREQQARLRRGLRLIAAVLWMWPWYPGDWLRFGGRQPRRLMRDWLSTARTGRYDDVHGLAEAGAQLARANGAVIAINIEGDSLAPPDATRALLRLAPGLQVDHAVVASARLLAQSPTRRHNLWPREPQAVLPHLTSWLRRHWPDLGPPRASGL
jgi:predicted alpha/beta hydrolase